MTQPKLNARVFGRKNSELDRRSFLEHCSTMVLTAAAANIGEPVCKESSPPHPPAQERLTLRYFPGFKTVRVQTTGAVIHAVLGGTGPPVLLLHGWPQTHIEWHKIASILAKRFTVVAADLRGYGDSSKPADGDNHEGYSKRAMARDQVELMQYLGFNRFAVVGHDRGGRVAHRMALDYAKTTTQIVVLDIVPTYKLYTTVTKDFAAAYYHWFFFIQPTPLPETLLGNNAEFFLRTWLFQGLIPSVISDEAFREYLRWFRDPATLHAMCEDYRAAATIDLDHDKADLNKKIHCPLLTLWGKKGAMGRLYDVVATWQERASNVRGRALPGGHWLPEELPIEVSTEIVSFLSSTAQ